MTYLQKNKTQKNYENIRIRKVKNTKNTTKI